MSLSEKIIVDNLNNPIQIFVSDVKEFVIWLKDNVIWLKDNVIWLKDNIPLKWHKTINEGAGKDLI